METLYKGSYINKENGKKFRIHFTYNLKEGRIVNEEIISKKEL